MKGTVTGFILGIFVITHVCGQVLTTEQKTFLANNAKVIRSIAAEEPNWSSLLPHIKGKKLILLGEFTHGAKEIFELRNSLIRYLHQEVGANVILFESGMGEVLSTDVHKDQLTPDQMISGLVGVWRTKEFVSLMDYVKTEHMSIAGFDVQRSGTSFSVLLKELGKRYAIDTAAFYNLESRYTSQTRGLSKKDAVYDSLKDATAKLTLDYRKLSNVLGAQTSKESSNDLLIAQRTIGNRITYLSYMLRFLKDNDWNKRWMARDSAMAGNTQWLVENIYKDRPLIVIGHNFHIGKFNQEETVMGEILKARYDQEMYSIGFFAGAGSYADNMGNGKAMLSPDPGALDIKHIVANLKSVSFIDIPEKFSKGSEWLNQEITVNDTFINLKNGNKMNLSKTFDGLLLLDHVTPAKGN